MDNGKLHWAIRLRKMILTEESWRFNTWKSDVDYTDPQLWEVYNPKSILNSTCDYTSFHVDEPNVLECKDKMINYTNGIARRKN